MRKAVAIGFMSLLTAGGITGLVVAADAPSSQAGFPNPMPADISFQTVLTSQPFPGIRYPVPIIGWKAHPEEVHVVPTGALVFPAALGASHMGLYLTPLISSCSARLLVGSGGRVKMLAPDQASRELVDGFLPGAETAWSAGEIEVRQLAFCTLLAGTEVHTGAEPLIALTRYQLTNRAGEARRATFALNFGRAMRRHSLFAIPPSYQGQLALEGSLVVDRVNDKVVAALLKGPPSGMKMNFRPAERSRVPSEQDFFVLNGEERVISGPEYSVALTRRGQSVHCGKWHSEQGLDLHFQASPMHGVPVAMELEILTVDGAVRKAGRWFQEGLVPSTQAAGKYTAPGERTEPIRWAVLSKLIPEGDSKLRLRCCYPTPKGPAPPDSWEPILYLARPGVLPEFKHQSGDPVAGSLWIETTLNPGESKHIDLAVPYYGLDRRGAALLAGLRLDRQLALFRRFWTRELNCHAEFIVPEKRIRDSYRACLAYNMILCDHDPVTGFLMPHPDATDYEYVWGGDSGVAIPAMDRFGFHDLSRDCLNWFLAKQGHRKPSGDVETQEGFFSGDTPPKWMSDNGFILNAMACHYWLTGDADWLRGVAPKLIKACDWFIHERARTKKLEQGAKPRHFGLLPRGQPSDLDTWDYWYWTDTYSYMGLRQTAEAFADIGMAEQASRLAAEADDYKACILDSLDRSINRQVQPPFVPPSPYRNGTPTFESLDRDWYSICSPIYMVEAGLLHARDDRVSWIQAWLERLVTTTGLPALGKGQIDPHYVYNTALSHLLRRETDQFLWSFYSLFAYGQARDTYATLEGQNLLTGSNGDAWDANRQPHMHSNGRVLDMVRIALVLEDGARLHLLAGTPRGWLADGQRLEVKRAPTRFGEVALTAVSHLGAGKIVVTVQPPRRKSADIILHLRPPTAAGPIRSVTVNGHPWKDWSGETIRLGALKAKTEIRCTY